MKQARTLLRFRLLPFALLLAMQAVMAQQNLEQPGMADPTRPPPPSMMSGIGGGPLFTGPLLQSVIITPTERSAIIGGERVKLGGKYGDARVVRISEGEVVLRSARGNETLRLYQDIEMKPVRKTAVGN
jgi:MSHA biogenesis protein MshK